MSKIDLNLFIEFYRGDKLILKMKPKGGIILIYKFTEIYKMG